MINIYISHCLWGCHHHHDDANVSALVVAITSQTRVLLRDQSKQKIAIIVRFAIKRC